MNRICGFYELVLYSYLLGGVGCVGHFGEYVFERGIVTASLLKLR